MNFELPPMTELGERLVVLAETHARDVATRADQHDREGSFPFENVGAMQQSGPLAAGVPVPSHRRCSCNTPAWCENRLPHYAAGSSDTL